MSNDKGNRRALAPNLAAGPGCHLAFRFLTTLAAVAYGRYSIRSPRAQLTYSSLKYARATLGSVIATVL